MLLFDRHREVIFRVAYRLTNSAAAAEDITQECFLGLLDAPGRFDPGKGSLRTYLYGAARNHARRYYGLRDGDVDLEDTEVDEAAEVSQMFLQQEQSQVIRQAISTLPLQQREAQGTRETQANSYTVLSREQYAMKPSDDGLNCLLKAWTVPQSPDSLRGASGAHTGTGRALERRRGSWKWLRSYGGNRRDGSVSTAPVFGRVGSPDSCHLPENSRGLSQAPLFSWL
jgi:RNA polymerase sigma factor (sigma-70 family)